ncbi:MAG: CTP synthase, partial [Pseudomonadota bacterium]|nr:CTP synthase [Pseudomonadota bacterium]
MTRFIFITGGVVSSLGKGLSSASLASLLQSRGFTVRLKKLDPYLNVDPGTMSPIQHGEVYVTDDGAETDLDFGHYERFTGVSSRQSDNVTTGQIYSQVIANERKGNYLGATVQVIPHVTDALKEFITNDLNGEDFVLCEIGGTVGDIESLPFLEAIRQLRNDLGEKKTLFIHLTLLPYIASSGELKTKPTQHSVKELLSVGIQPDILLCRCDRTIPQEERKKIALFCNINYQDVISALDVDTIYQVPLTFSKQKLDDRVCSFFSLKSKKRPNLSKWKKIVERIRKPNKEVIIGVVGKYLDLVDSYKSLVEALTHGGIANRVGVKIEWLESEVFERKNPRGILKNTHGILVPGGFGERGAAGKIQAAKYAREKKFPYFGICFGMQMAVLEAAKNLADIKDASSTEFGRCKNPVIGLMTEWLQDGSLQKRNIDDDKGGTMRLGSYECLLSNGSLARKIYKSRKIFERHRHRYEVNIKYRQVLEGSGLYFSGLSPDGILPEIVEYTNHPWFVGVQFHPELKSRPFKPHPLF